jgi:hypothetical protein
METLEKLNRFLEIIDRHFLIVMSLLGVSFSVFMMVSVAITDIVRILHQPVITNTLDAGTPNGPR